MKTILVLDSFTIEKIFSNHLYELDTGACTKPNPHQTRDGPLAQIYKNDRLSYNSNIKLRDQNKSYDAPEDHLITGEVTNRKLGGLSKEVNRFDISARE